jgi:hypothetical protein
MRRWCHNSKLRASATKKEHHVNTSPSKAQDQKLNSTDCIVGPYSFQKWQQQHPLLLYYYYNARARPRSQPGSHLLIFRNYTYIFNFDGFANDIMFLLFVYSFVCFFAGWSDSWGTAITTKSRSA